MGEFYNKLINAAIPHPTQKSFKIDEWNHSFTEYSSGDELDLRIFLAGKWVYDKLVLVRAENENIEYKSISKVDYVLSLFAVMNRDCVILNERRDEIIASDGTINLSTIGQKKRFHPLGPEISFADQFESVIEGHKHSLRFSFQSENFGSKTKNDNELVLLDLIKKSSLLGQYYLLIEDFWSNFLYQKYFVEENDTIDYLKYPTESDVVRSVIAKSRYDSISLEAMFYSRNIWKEMSAEFKEKFIDFEIVTNIRREGKRKVYNLGKYSINNDAPPFPLIAELQAREIYFDNLIHEALPNLLDTTLNDLLKVWHILYSIADQSQNTLPKNTEVKKLGSLKLFNTFIKYVDLKSVIKQSLKFPSKKTEAIIDFFCYTGERDDELWMRPFYKIDDNLYFCFGAIMLPNLLRSIEFWMKKGGLDLSERGHLFENHAREEISDAIKYSKKLKNIRVIPSSVKIIEKDIEEEIDLVICLGNKFILGEIKCVLFPTSVLEEFRFDGRLIEAKEQIKRKLKFIADNKGTFLKKLGLYEQMIDQDVTFVPIILTNLLFGTGLVLEGIPVTDLLILNKYIIDGEFQIKVTISVDGTKDFSKSQSFYNNEEEAISNIEGYLLNPPLLGVYHDLVSLVQLEYPVVFKKGKAFLKEEPEIDISKL